MICGRHAVANNEYVLNSESEQSTTHLVYLDCNNLYGCSMSERLPISNFRWLDRDEIDALNVVTVDPEGDTGYILEVDLTYPSELHDLHNNFPLAPESMTIDVDMLSPYSRGLRDKLDIGCPTRKFVPNLHDKQCIDLGMRLTAVHRVLAFNQSAWLKPYIAFNTEQPMKARNLFDKDLFKLMNNAMFGKTMENLRKCTDIKMVKENKIILKQLAKPSGSSSWWSPSTC